jgi:hypothetical protein
MFISSVQCTIVLVIINIVAIVAFESQARSHVIKLHNCLNKDITSATYLHCNILVRIIINNYCVECLYFRDCIQGRQSIPKSRGDGLQTRKVRRYPTRNFFLNFGTLKRYSQRFGGTYKVILQCA